MQRYENRRAVITGTATGLGRAIAQRLAAEGARLELVDIDRDGLTGTQAAVHGQSPQTQVGLHLVDVADEAAVQELARTLGEDGPVHVLVNNAGVDSRGGKVHEYPTELFDRIIAVDLKGTFLMTKHLVPLMFDAEDPAIVNMASFSGLAADFDRSGYNAAKGGVVNFTRATAVDYGEQGIRANAVCPGTIETPLIDKLAGSEDEAEGRKFREDQTRVTPLRRLGDPSEIGAAVAFLGSSDASFITGQTLTVDGGVMAYTWPQAML